MTGIPAELDTASPGSLRWPNGRVLGLYVVLALSASVALQLGSVFRESLPLLSDQDGYLAAADLFSRRLLVEPKAPLYSAWLGIFDLLSGHDAWRTFATEKIVSLTLFGIGMGWLGYRLHSIAAGTFLLLWAMNLKYMVIESNGSNTFATLLMVFGAIAMLHVTNRWRAPIGALTLFLASLARPEFAPLTALYVAGFSARAFLRARRAPWRSQAARIRPWLVVGLVAVGTTTLVRARRSGPGFSSNLAIVAGYSVTYVDRHGLRGAYPTGWGEAREIWERAFPTIETPLKLSPLTLLGEMWRADRSELTAHLAYNGKRSIRILAAVLFGVQSRLLLIASFALYLVSLVREHRRESSGHPPARVPGIVWGMVAGTLLMIPIAIVILPLWRYFIPLTVPFMLATVSLLTHVVAMSRGAEASTGRTHN